LDLTPADSWSGSFSDLEEQDLGPPGLRSIDAAGRDFERAARSDATWRAYRSDMDHFAAWCESYGLASLPASEMTVARYLTALAETGRKPSTIRRRIASISVAHEMAHHHNPTRSALIRDRMAGITRKLGVAERQATPAMTPEIQKMVAALGDDLHGIRDRLIILLGFAAALRRSELSGLDVEDLCPVPEGVEVTIRCSKTDQEGSGAIVPVPFGSRLETCPVRACNAWLEATELISGPLIRGISRDASLPTRYRLLGRLSPEGVNRVVHRTALRSGLDHAANWSGHSLRAGLATSAAKAGVPDRVIMATTRHKSRTTLDRYIRAGNRWDQVAAASVGL